MIKKGITAVLLAACIQTSVFASAPWDIQLHWTGNAVNTLMENGVMKGYPDGRFRPDHALTREEAASVFAAILKKASAGDVPDEQEALTFPDVEEGRWSHEAIGYLTQRGILRGNDEGLFRPTAELTRQEFAAMLYGYIKDWGLPEKEPVNLTDLGESYAQEAIWKLCAYGVLGGYDDGTFRPKQPVSRGEAAAAFCTVSGFEVSPVQVEIPAVRTIDVPYISQLYPVRAVVGCEATSLLMGLKGKGYAQDIDLRTFLDGMPKTTSNPAKGFVGSPYKADPSKKTRTTIYPPILAEYASQYGKVSDFSDSSVQELRAELLAGNPVVIYATMRWEKPFYRYYNIEGATQRLLSNNHAVLVCGYDSETNYYYIADPYNENNTKQEYRYWISGDTLEPIYMVRQHAIVVE